MSYTSSFHHGTDVVIGHNRRDEKHQEEKHIDPDGLHETWIDEPIEEAYERLFGEALKEYNEKQKRIYGTELPDMITHFGHDMM